MITPEIILTVIAVIAATGGVAAYFKRSEGQSTITLLQTNIQAYKDSELLKDREIAYLHGQLVIKEKVIEKLVSDANGKNKRSSR